MFGSVAFENFGNNSFDDVTFLTARNAVLENTFDAVWTDTGGKTDYDIMGAARSPTTPYASVPPSRTTG